jgi:quercetin dioxygenase-like cupin family protein
MLIRRFVKDQATPAHSGTILAHGVLPEGLKPPFGHAYGYLEAGAAMEAHAHPTEEVYIILNGSGEMEVAGEKRTVTPGDVIALPQNASHSLTAGSDEPLLWAAFWWEVI